MHRWQRSREVFGHRVEIGDGKFYPIQPVLVTYTIGKLPLHLRSGTRNYGGKNAAELYQGERQNR
jgi:hypothetical protein